MVMTQNAAPTPAAAATAATAAAPAHAVAQSRPQPLPQHLPQNLIGRYRTTFGESLALYQRAQTLTPQGVHSFIRAVQPFPVFVHAARGARKTTVDGREVIDYWMGHGSLLFGHGDRDTQAAVSAQLARGTHFAAPSDTEVAAAELFCHVVPWAERVRFCASGSESVALAMRLARAVTGRTKCVRLAGHYHGWYDDQLDGALPRAAAAAHQGMTSSAKTNTILCAPNNLEQIEDAFRTGDVAAIILEPNGGFGGAVPNRADFLPQLRTLASRYDVVLVFDEMITGFRYHNGGAATLYNVQPDLATYGKALFGGLPGAALAGSAELMDRIGPKAGAQVVHQGTWNAAPLSMAASVSVLTRLAQQPVAPVLNRRADTMRQLLRQALDRAAVPGQVYGEASTVHVSVGQWPLPPGAAPSTREEVEAVQMARMAPANLWLRAALLIEGVDFFPFHMNVVSTAHTDAEMETTAAAMTAALCTLAEEGVLPQ